MANADGRLRSQGAGEEAAIGSSCSWHQRQPQALAGQKVQNQNPEAPCQAKRQRRVRLNSGVVFLFAFAPASGSASSLAITSFAGVRWRSAERHDTLPARGTLRASSRKKEILSPVHFRPNHSMHTHRGETNTRRQSLAALQIAKPRFGGSMSSSMHTFLFFPKPRLLNCIPVTTSNETDAGTRQHIAKPKFVVFVFFLARRLETPARFAFPLLCFAQWRATMYPERFSTSLWQCRRQPRSSPPSRRRQRRPRRRAHPPRRKCCPRRPRRQRRPRHRA